MASTSEQGFYPDTNYRCWLEETFVGHETADDELSDTVDGYGNMIQPSDKSFHLTFQYSEPVIGMEFESAESAREFYEMYGRLVGFTIRNNRMRRSLKDNSVIGREFVCSREGFRSKKCANRVLPSRPAFRGGCNAVLRITAKDGGKWVIYGFVKEHNHALNPSNVSPRRSHRIAFCEDEKDLKIRELSTALHREKKKSAAYKEQLQKVWRYVEEHTQRLSLKIEVVTNNIKGLEAEEHESSFSG